MKISTEYIGSYPYVKIEGAEFFDVGKIFDCGQCFRFDRVEDSCHEVEYSGVAFGKFVSFAQDGDTVYVYGSDESDFESIWRKYLDIDRDYALIGEDILSNYSNGAMQSAIEYGKGIRILSQDPFECMISFII